MLQALASSKICPPNGQPEHGPGSLHLFAGVGGLGTGNINSPAKD